MREGAEARQELMDASYALALTPWWKTRERLYWWRQVRHWRKRVLALPDPTERNSVRRTD